MKINKDNIIYFLLGIIIGIFTTAFSGVILYKMIKSVGHPERYTAPVEIKKAEAPKAKSVFREFYLSFEKSSDLDVFKADGTRVELSREHATHGKHSLMARIQPGSDYPGLMWEVYGREAQDWTGAKDFHFDVYNNTEDNVRMEAKFKSGSDYPKKSYSYPVNLEPLKMNSVSIPMESIAGSCDITKMSYAKLFVQSPQKEIVLYFDNVGTRPGTKEDEKSDVANNAAPQAGPAQSGALKQKEEIFIASSLDRIFQDGKTLVKPDFTQSADIQLAKNEYESFQVVVSSGKSGLKDARLEIESLGEGIKADWRVVGYVPTKQPYYSVKFVGLWPDPLLSVAKIDIAPGITQPFWVTLHASAGAEARVYQGKIKVVAQDKVLKEIPLTVRVENFTLSLESHLKTAFDFYGHETYKRFPKKEDESDNAYKARLAEINERFIIDMLQHRMNPVLNIDPSSASDLDRVVYYKKYGLNNFSIGKKGGTFNNNWPQTDEEIENLFSLYRGYGETLKINNMLQDTYIYTWDESKINDPQVAKICSMIHRAYPELKNMVCYHGFWDPAKYPDWGKDIDIWCFGIDDYNEAKVKTLQDRGMEMWMYISGPGSTGAPNLAVDFDSLDYRIIPWLCWKYDLKGFLYWCVNWWPLVDPYQSAANTKWEQNGNGLLFYPGEDGPVDSLRAEIYRDGMEDYEYLYLLNQKIAQLEAKGLDAAGKEAVDKAKTLLKIDRSIAGSFTNYSRDPRMICQRRKDIAASIEALEKL